MTKQETIDKLVGKWLFVRDTGTRKTMEVMDFNRGNYAMGNTSYIMRGSFEVNEDNLCFLGEGINYKIEKLNDAELVIFDIANNESRRYVRFLKEEDLVNFLPNTIWKLTHIGGKLLPVDGTTQGQLSFLNDDRYVEQTNGNDITGIFKIEYVNRDFEIGIFLSDKYYWVVCSEKELLLIPTSDRSSLDRRYELINE